MKILLPSILTIAFTIAQINAIAQKNNFSVSGSVEGLDTKQMVIRIPDSSVQRRYRNDTIKVVNGKFEYHGVISQLALVPIYPEMDRLIKGSKRKSYIPVKSSSLYFLASPGAKIYFTGSISDFVDAYPSGNAANEDLARLYRQINPLTNKAANIQVKLSGLDGNPPVKDSSLSDSLTAYDKQVSTIKMNFIETNVNSIASIWLLSDMMLRQQINSADAVKLFEKINKKLKDVSYYKDVRARTESTKMVKVGGDVPNIETSSTLDGKIFKLSDFRGKYVLIDFWGTWCIPCMEEMPAVKNYARKFPENLVVVGIAKESDDGSNWRRTIERLSLNWNQVLENSNDNFVLKFNVNGYPTKILVDPSGKIIARHVGQADEIFKKLDQLLIK